MFTVGEGLCVLPGFLYRGSPKLDLEAREQRRMFWCSDNAKKRSRNERSESREGRAARCLPLDSRSSLEWRLASLEHTTQQAGHPKRDLGSRGRKHWVDWVHNVIWDHLLDARSSWARREQSAHVSSLVFGIQSVCLCLAIWWKKAVSYTVFSWVTV